MLLNYISLAGGLVVLIVAGDLLVKGSVGVALRLGIPNLVIGLTIVAFGTSAPELFISLNAALEGSGGIAIGNVVGSNIANVLLVLGLPALIATTPCGEEGAVRNAIFMVAVSVVFVSLCFFSPLGLQAGAILLVLLALFLSNSAFSALKHRKKRKAEATRTEASETDGEDPHESDLEEVEGMPASTVIAGIYVLLGLVGLPLGAHFTIEGATAIAKAWGVSDTVIGLTVIALGTSLPELATTVMAAVRQHGAVAIGNVIGSNIFNLLAIIGITVVIVPIDVPAEVLKLDIWVMLACAALLFAFAAFRINLGKLWGAFLTAAYILYIFVVYYLGLSA